jgi:hypothetical protein
MHRHKLGQSITKQYADAYQADGQCKGTKQNLAPRPVGVLLLLAKPGLHDALLLMEQFGLLFKLFELGFRHGLDPWGTDARRERLTAAPCSHL